MFRVEDFWDDGAECRAEVISFLIKKAQQRMYLLEKLNLPKSKVMHFYTLLLPLQDPEADGKDYDQLLLPPRTQTF